MVRRCWNEEDTPAGMLRGVFLPLWKSKGSMNDRTKYRFICLTCHSLKLLDKVFLNQMVSEAHRLRRLQLHRRARVRRAQQPLDRGRPPSRSVKRLWETLGAPQQFARDSTEYL